MSLGHSPTHRDEVGRRSELSWVLKGVADQHELCLICSLEQQAALAPSAQCGSRSLHCRRRIQGQFPIPTGRQSKFFYLQVKGGLLYRGTGSQSRQSAPSFKVTSVPPQLQWGPEGEGPSPKKWVGSSALGTDCQRGPHSPQFLVAGKAFLIQPQGRELSVQLPRLHSCVPRTYLGVFSCPRKMVTEPSSGVAGCHPDRHQSGLWQGQGGSPR